MIKLSTLFSGSAGNCTLVESEKTAVLVDCGRNCKAVCTALCEKGLDISDISAVFVTHEHRDHISALDVLMRKRAIPIHVTFPSARELCRGRSAAENAVVHTGMFFEEAVGDLKIKSFPLPHDSAAHVGYVIEDESGDRAAVATDMGYATQEAFNNLCGCRQIVLEANHDVDMLKTGPYPYQLKMRILSRFGHLSNVDCGELCRGLWESGTKAFLLAHLSEENNTPDVALNTVIGAFQGCDCLPVIKIAKRNEITEL
ncbi:MAG: MBL fold metallo-hydrolase [Clostridia bacterium]|nr:MBL fold metallo-hydrolase [Clostridia bacterium]